MAPLPLATMIDIGVASPSAHGHAMISTATALTSRAPGAARAPRPPTRQTPRTATAIDRRNEHSRDAIRQPLNRRAAPLRRATAATMRASSVSAPTFSARITKPPVPFTVAPTTRSPGCLWTGTDSPVTIDSSTSLAPDTTTPSTGMLSPGRTRRRSPTCTCASGTSSSAPSGADAPRGRRRQTAATAEWRRWYGRARATPAPVRAARASRSPPPLRSTAARAPSRRGRRRGNTPGAITATTLVTYGHRHAESDQREHVQVPRHESTATPRTKNGQPAHRHTGVASASSIHGRARIGHHALDGRRDHAAHRDDQQRQCESRRDPEPARHVDEFRVLALPRPWPCPARAPCRRSDNRPGRRAPTSGCIGQVQSEEQAG